MRRQPWHGELFPLTPTAAAFTPISGHTRCSATVAQHRRRTSEVGFKLAGPWVPQPQTPCPDHSGSEPPGAHQRALLWVWGDVRTSRLQLQSPEMTARSGLPQQRSRCYRTHTCVQADTPNTDSLIFLSKTTVSAQSRSRGPSSVAAVAPGLEDQIRSHGMTGPSSSSFHVHESRV